MPLIPAQRASALTSSFATKEIAGRTLVLIPGGVFPMGSKRQHDRFKDALPRMVRVDDFYMGQCLETEGKWRSVMGNRGNQNAPSDDHPVTYVSYHQASEYFRRINATIPDQNDRLGFPTEAEYERMARGRPQNVRIFMDQNDLWSAKQLIEYLDNMQNPLENFISVDPEKDPQGALSLEIGKGLYIDTKERSFTKLVEGRNAFFAYFARPISLEKAIWNTNGTVPVSSTSRLGEFGVSDPVGHLWIWCGDKYEKDAYQKLPKENPVNLEDENDNSPRVLRAGSWDDDELLSVEAAVRSGSRPDGGIGYFGVRAAAAAPQKDPPARHFGPSLGKLRDFVN